MSWRSRLRIVWHNGRQTAHAERPGRAIVAWSHEFEVITEAHVPVACSTCARRWWMVWPGEPVAQRRRQGGGDDAGLMSGVVAWLSAGH